MLLVVIIMFYNVLWGFFIDPSYFGYNSTEQENPVLRILRFRDLPGLKLTWDFSGFNILPREAPREEEVNGTRPRGQTSTGGAGPWPGRATHAHLGLEPPLLSIFISRRSV
jgi:hypothetical protein